MQKMRTRNYKTEKGETMKLNKDEFWNLTIIKKTDYGVMLRTKTDICEYGQAYKKEIAPEEYKEMYLKFYYRLYLMDIENHIVDLCDMSLNCDGSEEKVKL